MRTYAQFFQLSTTGTLIEACGDRAAVRLDGRQSQATHELIAEQVCRERGFIAWQLLKGPSFLRTRPQTRVVSLFY